MRRKILIFVSILLSIFCFSCTNQEQYDIVTSCYPIYDFALRIVGDKLKVKNIVKAGVEPHEYEPSTRDVKSLYDCRLFLANGLGLENYLTNLPSDIDKKTFIITNDIEIIYENNIPDSHVWLNPLNAITMMFNIKEKIIAIDEQNKAYYEDNFEKNKKLFEDLDKEYKTNLQDLKSPYLITSHKAFSYLCKAYGLTQIAINGLSSEDEPSPESIAALIDQIKDLNATTIFYEELVSDKIAKSIAEQTGLKTDVLNPIEGLKENNKNEDYISIMKKNLTAIYQALK